MTEEKVFFFFFFSIYDFDGPLKTSMTAKCFWRVIELLLTKVHVKNLYKKKFYIYIYIYMINDLITAHS
jgi:hypothetical protein